MPTSRSTVQAVRVTGPLARYVAEFTRGLTERGYAPASRVGHLQVMAHLSRWMQEREYGLPDLSSERVDEYVAGRCASGYSSFRTRASLAKLLETLAASGAPLSLAPSTTGVVVLSRVNVLLSGFECFLREERGLTSSTTAAYLLRARRFLVDYTDDADLRAVTAATVSGAVLHQAQTRSVSSARVSAIALRWLLRYGHLAGLIDTDLSAGALPVTGRPSSSLPRAASAGQAAVLLRSCDRRTVAGRRDYAVILLLSRLGLRAGEVAGLRLEDLDWRAGQITVRGKGHRIDVLPLPVEVGDAIAGYLLRGRPSTAERWVFGTIMAPRVELSRRGVSWIVRSACVRSGTAPVGAHALRHALACQLLRAGAPLSEIGQLLRQHADITVSVYARVDVDRLRTVGRPWPGSSCESAS